MTWFDSHCHLEPDSATEVVERARAAGVTRMITVGTDAVHSRQAIAMAAAHDGVWATVGLHPHDAVQGVDSLADLWDSERVVAVGECGLDYHYDHSPRPVQREAFAAQIAIAHARRLPLVIHTREAWDDTFTILAAEGLPDTTIFHCFTGGADEARRALDLGGHLSFSGIVTFPKADDVRAAAALCPADRLLVETDAPYLAPVPHRGKRNEPAFVPFVGAVLAAIRSVPVATVESDTFLTSGVAFRLPST